MRKQAIIRFRLPIPEGVSKTAVLEQERLFNARAITHIPPEKLYLDLLKRQARAVMVDVTECPPGQIAAHLARLDGLREIFRHLCQHDFADHPEGAVSGAQLQYPTTLADFLCCFEITRQQHRCPAWVNNRDAAMAEINRKIDLLAGLFSQSKALGVALDEGAA